MIKSFIHKGLEDFFYDGTRKGIQAKHASKLETILDRLDAANEIKDMNYPGSGLHPLLPKTQGRWAIKVSGILDRLIHNAHKINLSMKGGSLRKKYAGLT